MTKMGSKKVRDVKRPHVVDGIEEYDNPLPSWWVWLFQLSIAFGILYLVWYHVLGKAGLDGELERERAAYAEQQEKLAAASSGASPEELRGRLKDPAKISEGQGHFQSNCAPCHGAKGEGGVGPNLTDEFWLHGGKVEDVLRSITKGIPDKGMIAWESILGPQKIEAVTAYVLSLTGSQPAGAKAPQGEKVQGD